jgi:hypothetical protein
MMRHLHEARQFAVHAWKQFSWTDLRWSYIAIAAMLLVGVLVNILLPNGWTIWPLIPVIGLLIVVNESADRNGQGVPPFQVYAFFGAVGVVWVIGVVIMSKVNPFVQLLGLGVMAYYAAQGYIKNRERLRIITNRRNEGCCIHCGEPADPVATICEECGLEIDPERTSQQRTAAISLYGKKTDRARSVLKPQSLGNIAAAKEKALIANSPRRRGKPQKRQ